MKVERSYISTIILVFVFSIAMAFLESAVVVYVRAIYYPDGFTFPLKVLEQNIAVTEFFREVATLIMLLAIGVIAGKRTVDRFGFFIFSFAIWDIFYYIFLKLLLDWPASLFTWDVLFFIPTTWVGPVLAPLINCAVMVLFALCIFHFESRSRLTKLGFGEWSLLIGGSLIIIFSYTAEYSIFMLTQFSIVQLLDFTNNYEVMKYATKYIPEYFNWFVFGAGCSLHLLAVLIYCIKYTNTKKNSSV